MLNSLKKWIGWQGAREGAVQNAATLVRSSDPQVVQLLGGVQTAAGVPVTPESAMRVSAVFAAVRLLAGALAALPVSVFKEAEGTREEIEPDLWWLLNEQPCPTWTAASLWEYVMASILLRGDGFVELQRRGSKVVGMIPHHPDWVVVTRIGEFNVYTVTDRFTSEVKTLHQDDMLHFAGFGFDGLRSMSVIQWAAFQSVGIAIASDRQAGNLFANGASPKHAIMVPGKMSPNAIETLKQEYLNKAGADNAGKPLVLTEGLSVKEMSLSAVDAELLDSRKFQVIDIARAFGVPPHMIGAQETTSSWGTGIEQMQIGFVKFSLNPYVTRIRQELNRKLFRRASPFVEHKLEALLAGDSKAEGEYNRQAVGGSMGPGWMTINELRKSKNLPPVDGGNKLYDPTKATPATNKEPPK